MEQVPLDIQLKILEELSPKDVVSLCQTSSKMKKICGDPRFNRYWSKSLETDFNLLYYGPTSYEEYKRVYHLYNDYYATVTKQDPYYPTGYGRETYLFVTLNDAIEYVINLALEKEIDTSVPRLYAKINNEGKIRIDEFEYVVLEANFVNNKERPLTKYKESIKNFMKSLNVTNPDEMSEYIINTIDTLAEEMVQDGLEVPSIDSIDEAIEEICSSFEIDDKKKCDDIRSLVFEVFIR